MDNFTNVFLAILIVELIVLALILITQGVLWNRLNNFKIRLLLIISRLHEKDVFDIIYRYL
jgi:hypothetical protein